MYRPDGNTEKFSFNEETGYRAKVRLTNRLKVIYEGFMYYRMVCMNPLRSETISVEAKVVFKLEVFFFLIQ